MYACVVGLFTEVQKPHYIHWVVTPKAKPPPQETKDTNPVSEKAGAGSSPQKAAVATVKGVPYKFPLLISDTCVGLAKEAEKVFDTIFPHDPHSKSAHASSSISVSTSGNFAVPSKLGIHPANRSPNRKSTSSAQGENTASLLVCGSSTSTSGTDEQSSDTSSSDWPLIPDSSALPSKRAAISKKSSRSVPSGSFRGIRGGLSTRSARKSTEASWYNYKSALQRWYFLYTFMMLFVQAASMLRTE